MRWFSSNSLHLNFKIFLLILFLGSFTSGLALARHLYPPVAPPLPASGEEAASVTRAAYEGDQVPRLLFSAFAASGAQLEAVGLEAWGSLNSTFLSGEALPDLAGRAAAPLGLVAGGDFTRQDEANFHALYWEGELQPGVALFFSLQSLAGAGGGGETYLLINLESRLPGGAQEVQAWQERITAAFRTWQTEPHLTYSLIGFIPGRLAPGERQQRARAVLDALEAKQVEGVEDEEMYSVSAYSPLLPHRLEVAGRRINTNVALRYHATDDRTYLHLGFPLLGGEY